MKQYRKPVLALILAALMLISFAAPALAAPHGVTMITEVAGAEAASFSFLASGDPQLGAGGLESDRAGWLGSLANAAGAWDDLAFLITAGDQVNTNRDLEALARRIVYTALFDLFGVDLALTGRDHIYTRSKPMRRLLPDENGLTYLTMNSGSGSKYYDMAAQAFKYAEASLQVRVPSLTRVDVAPGALTLTTVRTDTMEVLDSFRVNKL